MDVNFILGIFKTTWYFWALLLVACVYRMFRPIIKGFLGEKSVVVVLAGLDKKKYLVLHNIMLQTGARTTQIDHIVVSNFGVFVIETKNYKGWILGNEKDENWTQVIYKRRERIHNPIRQNAGHILALKELLSEFTTARYFPIVAFSSAADLKVKTTTPVVYIHRLKKEIAKHNDECLDDDTKLQIHSRLQALNIDSADNRKEHVRAVKGELAARQDRMEKGLCPKCGSPLVQRQGKRGVFRGCSGFPKCRYVLR